MLCCDWLVFSSCDWCISIFAASVYCSLGSSLSHGSPVGVFLVVGILDLISSCFGSQVVYPPPKEHWLTKQLEIEPMVIHASGSSIPLSLLML